MELDEYFAVLINASQREDGQEFGRCFTLNEDVVPGGRGLSPVLQRLLRQDRIPDIIKQAMEAAGSNSPVNRWAQPAGWFLTTLGRLHSPEQVVCFESYFHAVKAFMDALALEERSGWAHGVVYNMLQDLRVIAKRADKTIDDAHARGEVAPGVGEMHTESRHCTRQTSTVLNQCFSTAFSDRRFPSDPDSRRCMVLFISCMQFRVYFQLNTLRLCKSTTTPIDGWLPQHEQSFGMADRVTYKYFTGLLAMYEDQLQSAEEKMAFCLRHCPERAESNRKRILRCLIPIKMAQGGMPKDWVLRKYQLRELQEIVAAVRTGDLGGFNRALETHEDVLIRHGTFLLLEKTRLMVYRNLFKKAAKVLDPEGLGRIKVAELQLALRINGEDMDLDEVECVVANLIYKGAMKGYIAHNLKIIVTPKKGAIVFPKEALSHLCTDTF